MIINYLKDKKIDNGHLTRGKKFHLAGIIPVLNEKRFHGYEWQDFRMPACRYDSILRHIVRIVTYSKCESIWIVSLPELIPLIQKHVKDYRVYKYHNGFGLEEKFVPIYYVSCPETKHRRKNFEERLSWFVLYGIYRAFITAKDASMWLVPGRYFIYPTIYNVVSSIDILKNGNSFFTLDGACVSYEGKTFKDGLRIPFSVTGDEWNEAKKKFYNLPPKEKILEKLFEDVIINKVVDTKYLYDLSYWHQYVEFLQWYGKEMHINAYKREIEKYNKNKI